MVRGRAGVVGVAIDLKDSDLPVVNDEEISLAVVRRATEPPSCVREEGDIGAVEGLGDLSLRLRSEADALPLAREARRVRRVGLEVVREHLCRPNEVANTLGAPSVNGGGCL